MSLHIKILYIITLLTVCTYLILKLKYSGYIFSFFNAQYLFYLVSVFIVGIFSYNDQAWEALSIANAKGYWKELDDMYLISLLGLLVMHLSMIYFEIIKTNVFFEGKIVKKISDKFSFSILDLECRIMAVIVLGIFIIYNKGKFPIFNGNRLFYFNQSFSYPYQIAVTVLTYGCLLYFFRYCFEKKFSVMPAAICILLFATGTRGNLISKVIYPIFIFYVYYRGKHIAGKEYTLTLKIFAGCFILGIFAIWMQFLRSGSSGNHYLNAILYGNTFCDIRDGAFLLKAFREKIGGFLYGKTYLAGLISFLPSKISKYKFEWGWGRFSAAKLIGWHSHPGFHAGNSTEAYFNFGWVGVIIFSIVKGYIFASLEKIYRSEIFYKICRKEKFDFKIIIILFAILAFGNLFDCTSAANGFWLLIAMILGNIVITVLLKNKDNERFGKGEKSEYTRAYQKPDSGRRFL